MENDWQFPRLKIKPPEGALTQGFPELPDGMMAWRNKKNKYTVLVVGYYSDPEARSKEWWEKATEGLLPHEIDAEYLCSFASRGGMKVLPWLSTNPAKFTRSHTNYRKGGVWTVPQHWHLIAGMDYGGNRNPTSFNIFAIDEKNDWHAIYEFYKPAHYKEIAEALLGHPLYPRLIKICLDRTAFKRDQHVQDQVGAFTSIGELLVDSGIQILEPANNDRQAGLARVLNIFNQRPGEDRPTHMFISDDCPNLFRELSGIVYKQETQLQLIHKNPSDDVEKKEDHGYDSVRYGLMGWAWEAEAPVYIAENPFALSNIEAEIDERYDEEERDGDLFN